MPLASVKAMNLPCGAPSTIDGPAIVGASWFAPTGAPIAPTSGARRLVHRDQTVGWVVPEGERWDGAKDTGPGVEIDGVSLPGTFALLTALEKLLLADCADFLAAPSDGVPVGSLVLGDPRHIVCLGASVEPGVVFRLPSRRRW